MFLVLCGGKLVLNTRNIASATNIKEINHLLFRSALHIPKQEQFIVSEMYSSYQVFQYSKSQYVSFFVFYRCEKYCLTSIQRSERHINIITNPIIKQSHENYQTEKRKHHLIVNYERHGPKEARIQFNYY